MRRIRPVLVLLCLALLASGRPMTAQEDAGEAARRKTLDTILDAYVRDGFVYYRALKADRAKLESYVGQLAAVPADNLPRESQLAFWLNAYDALVLKTVVDHYPIPTRSAEYPQHSIRQIPGAFERVAHRVGGRTLTLDQIEQTILAPFGDPRVFFAIGRGSIGGGRLRSEAFTPARIEAQLAEVAAECASRPQCVAIDAEQNKLNVSAIFSWREKEFVAKYATATHEPFENRSDIERAVLAFVWPKMLTTEKEFLTQNKWQMAYKPYDWRLNDLTGRGGR
jgi:hypothetical protein